ncbi:hypothetical protein BDQ17DRAFT_510234 [Cyathus striatus]|nr:hypothetical protein BDQ17DRAFT_510234 [Cyathus striatus]
MGGSTSSQVIGVPKASDVESLIRSNISGRPRMFGDQYIPGRLFLTHSLSSVEKAIKPFLDSIPAPFTWGVETEQESVFRDQFGVGAGEKRSANKLFRSNLFAEAIKSYKSAIKSLNDTLGYAYSEKSKIEVEEALAICHANLSAAYLASTPTAQQNLKLALHQATKAIEYDSSYAKGHFRLSKAQELLGDVQAAMDTLASALRIPNLENNKDLVDRLLSLQTDGRGLPNQAEEFKTWMKNLLVDDPLSAKRMEGVQGEWRNRVKTHALKFPDGVN